MISQEIILPTETSIDKTDTSSVDDYLMKDKQQIIKEITKALHDKWMDSVYIIDKIKYIVDEAFIINNNWDRMPDFKTMLKWVELLLKLSWINLDSKIKIAIFNNIPWKDERLTY